LRPTPEEIEARRFRLAQNGYDCESVDRFLAEIAEGLREPAPAPDPGPVDEFGRMGQEIAGILRSARDSASAIKAEAEGQAAALRSKAEVEASELQKSSEAEAVEVRSVANDQAEAIRAAARADATALRSAAEAEGAEIRVQAERQLEQAAQALARANEQAEAVRAGAQHEIAARIAEADEQARRRVDELTAEASRHAEAARESEQATYLYLLAARDDVQAAIDRLAAIMNEPIPSDAAPSSESDPIVDLTIAPAQVHPLTRPQDETSRPAPVSAPAASPGLIAPPRETETRSVGSADLDPDAGTGAADPLLRMVRAAVGRAAEASAGDAGDREASAS
jgi:DivIVA domain-containing protein